MPTILEEYIAKHPGSARRYEESVTIFPGGVTHDSRYATPFPLFMTHGEGPRKWDVDGNEYIDYVSGHGALLLGHSHPAIAEAVSRQITRGTTWRVHRRGVALGEGHQGADACRGEGALSQLRKLRRR